LGKPEIFGTETGDFYLSCSWFFGDVRQGMELVGFGRCRLANEVKFAVNFLK